MEKNTMLCELCMINTADTKLYDQPLCTKCFEDMTAPWQVMTLNSTSYAITHPTIDKHINVARDGDRNFVIVINGISKVITSGELHIELPKIIENLTVDFIHQYNIYAHISQIIDEVNVVHEYAE